ncbi:hypothetical protein A0H76_628 [Hepatospora eriocheir]|uniref:Uncharacterized protein n=1 Tax=Hepatospora eriocheir TaxID=1081669 RepID=A0A1X0QIG3_9MICR|nr:hypothetical protein A0H76_628 [Hepatospora eriocheir]
MPKNKYKMSMRRKKNNNNEKMKISEIKVNNELDNNEIVVIDDNEIVVNLKENNKKNLLEQETKEVELIEENKIKEEVLDDFIDDTIVLEKAPNEELENIKEAFKSINIKDLSLDGDEFESVKTNLEKSNIILSKLSDEDPIHVYMKPILNFIEGIYKNIKVVNSLRSNDRELLEKCYVCLMNNDIDGAKLCLESTTDENGVDLLKFKSIKESLLKFQSEFNILITDFKLLSKLSKIISKSNQELSTQNRILYERISKIDIDNDLKNRKLIEDANSLKDNLITLLSKHTVLDSRLENDLISRCASILNGKDKEIDKLKSDIIDLNSKITIKEDYFKANNVESLQKENKELQEVIKKLRQENINSTEDLRKLTEKNFKYKQNLILFNDEVRKLLDKDKLQSETIIKQKKLIEVMQFKLIEKAKK